MRANLFFPILEHARKIHNVEKNLLLNDFCDVAAIALGAKNYDTFKKQFRERAFGAPKRKALPLKDKNTAAILASAMRAALPKAMRGGKARGR